MANNPGWFKKGQSGNPGGRPKKGETFAEIFERKLEEKMREINSEGRTNTKKEALIEIHLDAIFDKNLDSDTRLKYLESVYSRVDGKPKQQIDSNIKTDAVVVVGAAPATTEEEDESDEGE